MSPKPPVVYEPVVFDDQPSPPRTRLYHLEPIGIGSPLTESFTSYLARLAHAHRVGPWILIKEEILPVINQEHLIDSLGGSLWVQAQALNSVGTQACRWVEAIGQLTGRQDLTWLTLLPWKQVLSSRELMRSERAWCPQCFRDWRASARALYEPLLWALTCVSVCPIHEEALRTRCPYGDCGQRLPPFHAHLLPGRCSRCFRWLDQHPEKSRPSPQAHGQGDGAQALQAAKAVGELLAAAPTLQVLLERNRLAEALQTLCHTVTQGNVSAMARLAGFHLDVVFRWTRGRGLPQLHSLVRFCDRIGTTPLDLLRDGGHTPVLLRDHLGQSSRSHKVRTQRRNPPRIETLRTALENVLADHQSPPPSVKQMAEQLGCHPISLRKRFRRLCRAISARHRRDRTDRAKKRIKALQADFRRAIRALVQQGLNPSRYRVGRYLKKPQLFWNSRAMDAWRRTLKGLGMTPGDRHRNQGPQPHVDAGLPKSGPIGAGDRALSKRGATLALPSPREPRRRAGEQNPTWNPVGNTNHVG